MDRREFVVSAAALSFACWLRGRARAQAADFDPTERSMSALLQALASGETSSEALTAAYLTRVSRFDQHGRSTAPCSR